MAVIANLVAGLKRAERSLEAQLKGIRAAIGSLAGGAPGIPKRRRASGTKKTKGASKRAAVAVKRKRKPMSAEARAKIAAAQRARWARVRAQKKR